MTSTTADDELSTMPETIRVLDSVIDVYMTNHSSRDDTFEVDICEDGHTRIVDTDNKDEYLYVSDDSVLTSINPQQLIDDDAMYISNLRKNTDTETEFFNMWFDMITIKDTLEICRETGSQPVYDRVEIVVEEDKE